MNKNFLLLSVACLALVAGALVGSYRIYQKESKPMPLPAFSFPDSAGKNHDIQEWQDKILVINFWATWCSPCLKEIPEFIQLQTELKHKNVQFIGIAIDDIEAVKRFQEEIPINYPILLGGDAKGFGLSRQLGNLMSALPYTVFVKNNMVISRHAGEMSKDDVIQIISTLTQTSP